MFLGHVQNAIVSMYPRRSDLQISRIPFSILEDISPLGLLIPLFWTSGDVSSEFQSSKVGILIWALAEVYLLQVPGDLSFRILELD